MTSDFVLFCRFHAVRLFHAHPVLSLASVVSALVLVVSFSFLMREMHESAAVLEQLNSLVASSRRHIPAAPLTGIAQPTQNLPWFQSSSLLDDFSRIAEHAKLPLDEVGYVLEEGVNRPFMRYRITMTVAANYPSIRQFVTDVSSTLKNVDLDSISCNRADIVIAPLTCELAFSAFFRTDQHG
jgi:Tfp pilus assembly protein PilO